METVKFDEYEEGKLVLIDIESCPPPMAMDYLKRNENVKNGKQLCDVCDGTGNEFYSMYKACTACNASGEKHPVNATQKP